MVIGFVLLLPYTNVLIIWYKYLAGFMPIFPIYLLFSV